MTALRVRNVPDRVAHSVTPQFRFLLASTSIWWLQIQQDAAVARCRGGARHRGCWAACAWNPRWLKLRMARYASPSSKWLRCWPKAKAPPASKGCSRGDCHGFGDHAPRCTLAGTTVQRGDFSCASSDAAGGLRLFLAEARSFPPAIASGTLACQQRRAASARFWPRTRLYSYRALVSVAFTKSVAVCRQRWNGHVPLNQRLDSESDDSCRSQSTMRLTPPNPRSIAKTD